MKVLSAAMLLLSVNVSASEVDWLAAEGGISFQGKKAFAGCAKLTLQDDEARKVAVLRASANNARTHSLSVSGSEHLVSSDGASAYRFKVTESAAAYLQNPTILHEEVVLLEGDASNSLCVLIAGD